MLTAFVLVCALNSAEDCIELKDIRGPYATKDKCYDRVQEIVADARGQFDNDVKYMWKCTVDTDVVSKAA